MRALQEGEVKGLRLGFFQHKSPPPSPPPSRVIYAGCVVLCLQGGGVAPCYPSPAGANKNQIPEGDKCWSDVVRPAMQVCHAPSTKCVFPSWLGPDACGPWAPGTKSVFPFSASAAT